MFLNSKTDLAKPAQIAATVVGVLRLYAVQERLADHFFSNLPVAFFAQSNIGRYFVGRDALGEEFL